MGPPALGGEGGAALRLLPLLVTAQPHRLALTQPPSPPPHHINQSFIMGILLTQVFKLMVGRLRPNFLARRGRWGTAVIGGAGRAWAHRGLPPEAQLGRVCGWGVAAGHASRGTRAGAWGWGLPPAPPPPAGKDGNTQPPSTHLVPPRCQPIVPPDASADFNVANAWMTEAEATQQWPCADEGSAEEGRKAFPSGAWGWVRRRAAAAAAQAQVPPWVTLPPCLWPLPPLQATQAPPSTWRFMQRAT